MKQLHMHASIKQMTSSLMSVTMGDTDPCFSVITCAKGSLGGEAPRASSPLPGFWKSLR